MKDINILTNNGETLLERNFLKYASSDPFIEEKNHQIQGIDVNQIAF
jgi:hypothetical protein